MSQESVTGRLIFRQAGPAKPVHNLSFEIYERLGLRQRKVAEGMTDLDGRFSVPLVRGAKLNTTVELRVLEQRSSYKGGERFVTQEPSTHTRFELGDGKVGDVQVTVWPYRTDFPTPRAGKHDDKPAQTYTKGYQRALGKSLFAAIPSQMLLNAKHKINPSGPSMDEIQKHQPKMLTVLVDEKEPGRSRTDAWLGDQLLNGFDMLLPLGKDRENSGRYVAIIEWEPLMRPSRVFDIADCTVSLEEKDGQLLPVQIDIKNYVPDVDGSWTTNEQRFVSGDDNWEAAKRIVRCQYLLHGGSDAHVIRCHFQTELYACGVFRNIRNNPIRAVLEPHLHEIIAQDIDGDDFGWSEHGLLSRMSALSLPYLQDRMQRLTASWDWKTYRPRAPLLDGHRYAKAATLFWELLTEHLEAFFAANKAGIEANWGEVRAMSDDLVRTSPPYEAGSRHPRIDLPDDSELDNGSVPRAEVDGVVRAIRPVTTSEKPQDGEVDDLLQLCRYVLFNATFNHTWAHDGEYQASGELAYATWALRNGSLGAEDDPEIAPPPNLNIDAITTNSIGSGANYGFLIADEESDVPPALKAGLEKRRDAFAALDVDIDKIRARINI